MDKKINLSDNLQKLSDIASWFDEQQTVDVEEGLVKVKDAAVLIKESKLRLKSIENEFEEIKKEIDSDIPENNSQKKVEDSADQDRQLDKPNENVDPDDIPF